MQYDAISPHTTKTPARIQIHSVQYISQLVESAIRRKYGVNTVPVEYNMPMLTALRNK